jgi:endonuclease YncB( thermonuclease family)
MFNEYRAKLHRVIDGDTFELDIDLGFGCWTRQTIRLQGLDCPERNTPEGRAAKAFTEAWFAVSAAQHVAGWIMIYPEKNTLGDFQRTFIRYVAEVGSYNDSRSLADDLRAAGYVKLTS